MAFSGSLLRSRLLFLSFIQWFVCVFCGTYVNSLDTSSKYWIRNKKVHDSVLSSSQSTIHGFSRSDMLSSVYPTDQSEIQQLPFPYVTKAWYVNLVNGLAFSFKGLQWTEYGASLVSHMVFFAIAMGVVFVFGVAFACFRGCCNTCGRKWATQRYGKRSVRAWACVLILLFGGVVALSTLCLIHAIQVYSDFRDFGTVLNVPQRYLFAIATHFNDGLKQGALGLAKVQGVDAMYKSQPFHEDFSSPSVLSNITSTLANNLSPYQALASSLPITQLVFNLLQYQPLLNADITDPAYQNASKKLSVAAGINEVTAMHPRFVLKEEYDFNQALDLNLDRWTTTYSLNDSANQPLESGSNKILGLSVADTSTNKQLGYYKGSVARMITTMQTYQQLVVSKDTINAHISVLDKFKSQTNDFILLNGGVSDINVMYSRIHAFRTAVEASYASKFVEMQSTLVNLQSTVSVTADAAQLDTDFHTIVNNTITFVNTDSTTNHVRDNTMTTPVNIPDSSAVNWELVHDTLWSEEIEQADFSISQQDFKLIYSDLASVYRFIGSMPSIYHVFARHARFLLFSSQVGSICQAATGTERSNVHHVADMDQRNILQVANNILPRNGQQLTVRGHIDGFIATAQALLSAAPPEEKHLVYRQFYSYFSLFMTRTSQQRSWAEIRSSLQSLLVYLDSVRLLFVQVRDQIVPSDVVTWLERSESMYLVPLTQMNNCAYTCMASVLPHADFIFVGADDDSSVVATQYGGDASAAPLDELVLVTPDQVRGLPATRVLERQLELILTIHSSNVFTNAVIADKVSLQSQLTAGYARRTNVYQTYLYQQGRVDYEQERLANWGDTFLYSYVIITAITAVPLFFVLLVQCACSRQGSCARFPMYVSLFFFVAILGTLVITGYAHVFSMVTSDHCTNEAVYQSLHRTLDVNVNFPVLDVSFNLRSFLPYLSGKNMEFNAPLSLPDFQQWTNIFSDTTALSVTKYGNTISPGLEASAIRTHHSQAPVLWRTSPYEPTGMRQLPQSDSSQYAAQQLSEVGLHKKAFEESISNLMYMFTDTASAPVFEQFMYEFCSSAAISDLAFLGMLLLGVQLLAMLSLCIAFKRFNEVWRVQEQIHPTQPPPPQEFVNLPEDYPGKRKNSAFSVGSVKAGGEETQMYNMYDTQQGYNK